MTMIAIATPGRSMRGRCLPSLSRRSVFAKADERLGDGGGNPEQHGEDRAAERYRATQPILGVGDRVRQQP